MTTLLVKAVLDTRDIIMTRAQFLLQGAHCLVKQLQKLLHVFIKEDAFELLVQDKI